MQYAATASLLLALSTAVSAGCYTGGASSTAADVAKLTENNFNALRLVCSAMTNGAFVPGQETQFCLTAANRENKWNFHIQRIGRDAALSVGDCIDGLRKEVTGCQHGGSTAYANWRYTYVKN